MTNHKILLVDDDRDVLEMLLSIFRRAGYTNLITAASGAEALRIWQREQPSMIVLDVMMPDMDGFSVLKEIRRTSRVPVLMLTARGEAEDRIEGVRDRRRRLSRQALLTQRITAQGRRNLKPRLPKAK